MSLVRYAHFGGQAIQPNPREDPDADNPAALGKGRPWRRPGVGRLLTGAGLCVLVLLLGELAKVGPVARLELRADEHIAGDRSGALTWLAKLASDIGTPETVGVGLMILLPVILLLMRRRLDAIKVLCMFAGAFTLAEIGKQLINEHRPPTALQVVAADSGASFPSGHATTAAVIAVALVVIAATFAWRAAAVVLGGLYAVAVAASRVYLGDHFPLDVLAGLLCAVAAAFVVTGLAALPALQPVLRRLDRTAGQRLAPAGAHRRAVTAAVPAADRSPHRGSACCARCSRRRPVLSRLPILSGLPVLRRLAAARLDEVPQYQANGDHSRRHDHRQDNRDPRDDADEAYHAALRSATTRTLPQS